MAAGIAARFGGQGGVERDDLRQVAELGLVMAVRRYQPHRGAGFLAYAVPTIRAEIGRYSRDNAWVLRPPPRSQEPRRRTDSATDDLIGVPDEHFAQIDNHESLLPLLAALGPRDRLILRLRFVHGCTQAEIGERIGVSQMQVSRLLTALLARLRRRMSVD